MGAQRKKTTTPEPSAAEIAKEEQDTKDALAAQPKRTIRLHQVPPDSTDRPLPDEYVHVNGYGYLIQRGVEVEVPETVYEVLVQAGRY